jgi:hypothetical protein
MQERINPLMRYARLIITLLVLAPALGACAEPKYVLNLSEERRIWVVRGSQGKDAAVFRCADGSGPDQPPKPVCIRAALVDAPQ